MLTLGDVVLVSGPAGNFNEAAVCAQESHCGGCWAEESWEHRPTSSSTLITELALNWIRFILLKVSWSIRGM